jgi:hypothetical protein
MDRFSGPLVFAPTEPALNEQVLEAAICVTHKLKGVEKRYPDQVLQAAHTRFRRGIGLQELLVIAAERNNGYRGSAAGRRGALQGRVPHRLARALVP